MCVCVCVCVCVYIFIYIPTPTYFFFSTHKAEMLRENCLNLLDSKTGHKHVGGGIGIHSPVPIILSFVV